MANVKPFVMDGKEYNVRVVSLSRLFEVADTDRTSRTQGGGMYREIVGTFYNFELTIERSGNDVSALDAVWDAISAPVESHVCVFPYNQHTLTQKMYITSGEQKVELIGDRYTNWGPISLKFVAMNPKVIA